MCPAAQSTWYLQLPNADFLRLWCGGQRLVVGTGCDSTRTCFYFQKIEIEITQMHFASQNWTQRITDKITCMWVKYRANLAVPLMHDAACSFYVASDGGEAKR